MLKVHQQPAIFLLADKYKKCLEAASLQGSHSWPGVSVALGLPYGMAAHKNHASSLQKQSGFSFQDTNGGVARGGGARLGNV